MPNYPRLMPNDCRGSSVVDEDENILGVFHAFDRPEDFEKKFTRAIS